MRKEKYVFCYMIAVTDLDLNEMIYTRAFLDCDKISDKQIREKAAEAAALFEGRRIEITVSTSESHRFAIRGVLKIVPKVENTASQEISE